MKKLYLFTLIISTFAVSKAQQVEEFSLLRETAFALNPAIAGTNGFLYGTVAGRAQFTRIESSPYTAFLGMHGQIESKNIGLGGYMLHDVTGPTGKTAASFSFAYHLNLNKRKQRYVNNESHILSFGASATVVQYRLAGNKLLLNDVDDPELYTSRAYKIFPDFSFGLYYKWKDHLYAGLSVPQLLGLNINYAGRDGFAKITRMQHINFMLGGKIGFADDKFTIEPVGAIRWVKGAPLQGDIGLRLSALKVIWVGANYRSLNYAVLEGGIRVKDYLFISYAYDFNFSKYRQDVGASHEVAINFKINKRSKDF